MQAEPTLLVAVCPDCGQKIPFEFTGSSSEVEEAKSGVIGVHKIKVECLGKDPA